MTIKPMKATKYAGPEKLPEDYCVQPKLDGVRCLAYWSGGELKLNSKTGKPLPVPMGLDTNLLFLAGPSWKFLDGELMLPKGYTFEQTVSAVRSGPQHELSPLVEYHLYDGVLVGGERDEFSSRFYQLDHWIDDVRGDMRFDGKPGHARLSAVETLFDLKYSPEAHHEVHIGFVEEGYEGTMYRDVTASYKHGQSRALQKRKDFLDEEFTIVGHKIAVGQHEGCVVWNVDLGNGRACEVTPAWSLERRRAVATVAESYYGKLLTVRFQERTADGSLRFPVGVEIRDYE